MDTEELAAEKPFSVIEYTNRQGSRIIAALDSDANWNVLCLAPGGHIHYFKWDHAELAFDAGDADVEFSKRATSERVTIEREVEYEAGRDHVFWTVRDRDSGYNKTFRDMSEATAHAEAIRQKKSATRKALHEAQKQYLKNRK